MSFLYTGAAQTFVCVGEATAGTGSIKFFNLHNLGPVVKPRDDNAVVDGWMRESSSGVTPLRQGFVVQAFFLICITWMRESSHGMTMGGRRRGEKKSRK